VLRTRRNHSLTLVVERRVAHAPRGEHSILSVDLDLVRIWDFGFRISRQRVGGKIDLFI